MSDPIVYHGITGGTSFDGNFDSTAPAAYAWASDADDAASSSMVFTSAASYAALGPAALGEAASEAEAFFGFAADELNVAFPRMAFSGYARSFDITPDIGVAVSTMTIYGAFSTYSEDFGPAISEMRFRTMASDEANVAMPFMPDFFSTANDIPPPDDTGTSFLLFQGSGFLLATVGFPTSSATDFGEVTDSASVSLTIHARDYAMATASLGSHLNGLVAVMDAASAGDAASAILMLIASSEAAATESAAAYLDMLLLASDIAIASEMVTTQLDAFVLVAALAEANDVAALVTLVDATDLADIFDSAAIERIALLVHALDAAVASDTAGVAMRMLVIGQDEAALTDATVTSLQALVHALDNGNVVGVVSVGSETYAIYGMTLAGSLMYEYTDIEFDSLTTIGNRLYGSSSTGTYLLEGDTDAGEDINASVRVGLSSLGTSLKKEVPTAYLGLTTDGTMLLKTTTTEKGVRRTTVKTLTPRVRDVVTDGRIDIGAKGNQATYFDFEVANLDGCDFELETIKVWPLPLNRRK